MLKRLLAGVMASLMATTGCASPKEKKSMEFAEEFMQKYVAEMEEVMPARWDDGKLDLKVTYSSCSEEEAEKLIDLDTDESAAKYNYYYAVDYTSDNIDDFYESYKGSKYVNIFYQKMQDLEDAKIGVKSHYFWWGSSHFDRYDKKKNVETRIFIIEQKGDPFIIYGKDHTHCYEIRSCDYGSFDLYVDDSMVYCYAKEHPDYGSVTSHNASSSSNTTSKKKYNSNSNSGSGSSSKHKYVYSDPYDAEDYDNADDFADDWAEEFGDGDYDDGYDDAYDYWEDAMD